MKNSTGQKKRKNIPPAPSNKTRWAYYMQAIEPKDEAINRAFPGYHPQWVAMSQAMNITGENFRWMRLNLGLAIKQCGAYLRVAPSTVRRWEAGTAPVPFTAFELLRLITSSAFSKLTHHRWDGWFINLHDGALVSPDNAITVTPEDINLVWLMQSKIARLEAENRSMEKTISQLQAENTRLRGMFLSQGVTAELAAMHERIGNLLTRINTAEILPFAKPELNQQEEAAA